METNIEIERRWLVKKIDREILDVNEKKHIRQGYFDTSPTISLRVRITDGKKAELTKKTGSGEQRLEENQKIDLEVAQFLMDERIVDFIEKTRYIRDGWEIDFFHGPLHGLVKAEFENPYPTLQLPPWIHDATEVTNSITDRLLAKLARDLLDSEVDREITEILPKRIGRIVITGGPCSGKSAVLEILRLEIGVAVHCVPETATIIIKQVGVRPPYGNRSGLRRYQRTLYRVQRGFETIADLQAVMDGKKALIIDRGTVDNAAYLPGGAKELEDVCRTSIREHEFPHYDLVVFLEPPPRAIYDALQANNGARYESYNEALAVSGRIENAWKDHPRFVRISNGKNWDDKVNAVRATIAGFLLGI